MKNKGISLITLIITIVVVIILAAAVILTLGNKNPVNDANLAALLSNKDNMQGKILFHVTKTAAGLPEENLTTKTILIANNDTNIIDNTIRVIEVTKNGKKIYLYRIDKNKYKNNVKDDVAEKPSTGSEWYVDEYGTLYLVYDYITSVPNYMKDRNNLSKNVQDFVIVIGDLLEKSIVDSVLISDTAENGVLKFNFESVENFQGAWLEVNGTPNKVGNDETQYSNELNKNDKTFNLGTDSLGNKYAHVLVATTETKVEIVKEFEITKPVDKWDGTVATSFARGAGTASDPYIIETAAQFAYFRDTVNSGNDYAGKTIHLTTDIDLNPDKHWIDETTGEVVFSNDAQNWVPIGDGNTHYQSVSVAFGGIFNGNYHTISGLYANNTNYLNYGLFAAIKPTATIENLIMDQIYIHNAISSNSTQSVAGIVGISLSSSDTSIYANVMNCGVESGYVEGRNNNGGYLFVSGVMGYVESASVKNCYNRANIMATKGSEVYAGGISGNRLSRSYRKLL